jgi:hypothetical protein
MAMSIAMLHGLVPIQQTIWDYIAEDCLLIQLR